MLWVMTPIEQTAPAPDHVRLLATIAFASALTGLLSLAALHVLKPDLDPTWRMISEYALGPFGWAMTLCFAAMALGCFSLVGALMARADRLRLKLGLIALAVAGLGLGMAAVYPMDPITVPPEQASFSGQMHGVAAVLGNPGFLAVALLLGFPLSRRNPWRDGGTHVAGLSHLVWIGFIAMTAAVIHIVATEPDMTGIGIVGIVNRMLMSAYCLWLMAVAWPLISVRNQTGR